MNSASLANPKRLEILDLCLSEERTSKELREKLRVSKPPNIPSEKACKF